jgi:DNA-binding NtrC family response regulator
MPLATKTKLQRVLATHEVFLIGPLRSRCVGFRIVAATHGRREQAVRTGRFRADLLYRLNVARVELLPLREWAEDLAVLFDHFAAQLAARSRSARLRLTPQVLERLRQHDWPGSARELRNLVEAASILCEGDALQPANLPLPPAAGEYSAEPTRILARWSAANETAARPPCCCTGRARRCTARSSLGTSGRCSGTSG